MGKRPGAVWLGDVIKAVAKIEVEPHSAAVACLGQDIYLRAHQSSAPTSRPATSSPVNTPTPALQPDQLPWVDAHHLPLLEQTAQQDPTFPQVALAGESTGVPIPPSSLRPAEHETLFDPKTEQSSLRSLVSARIDAGSIDTARLVEDAARCKPLIGLPRLTVSKTAPYLEILFDIGVGMDPFRRDQHHLADSIARAAGAQARMIQFRDCPTLASGAGPGPMWNWRTYRVPPTGSVVVVVTDLGTAGKARTDDHTPIAEEWLAFEDLLAAHRVTTRYLVPYSEGRIDRRLRARMRIITWDRSSSLLRLNE